MLKLDVTTLLKIEWTDPCWLDTESNLDAYVGKYAKYAKYAEYAEYAEYTEYAEYPPLFFLSKDQKSKISEKESSINSWTCLGHLVLFWQLSIQNKKSGYERHCKLESKSILQKASNLIFKEGLHHLDVARLDALVKDRASFSFETGVDRGSVVQQQLHLHMIHQSERT